MEWVNKKEGIFPSQEENGTQNNFERLEWCQIFDLAYKIFEEMKLDLENFCPERREKRNCPKKTKGRKGVGLEIICASKTREVE